MQDNLHYLGDIISKRTKSPISEGGALKANSERAALISDFVERINLERLDTKFKPVIPRVIAIKTAHLSLPDLYYFFSVCKQSKSFGRTFFGSLKIDKQKRY